jgi:hypothetical protein
MSLLGDELLRYGESGVSALPPKAAADFGGRGGS